MVPWFLVPKSSQISALSVHVFYTEISTSWISYNNNSLYFQFISSYKNSMLSLCSGWSSFICSSVLIEDICLGYTEHIFRCDISCNCGHEERFHSEREYPISSTNAILAVFSSLYSALMLLYNNVFQQLLHLIILLRLGQNSSSFQNPSSMKTA